MPDDARLFLESSTPRASIALLRGERVIACEEFTGDRSHNALLFAPLRRVLACLGAGERLAEVVIGTGPGSYSGTRVGIAAGQGVALVHGCPAAGLSSLLAAPESIPGALAVGDARRGAAWRMRICRDAEPAIVSPAEVEEEIRAALAEGLPVFSLETLRGLGLPAGIGEAVGIAQPRADLLARAWLALAEEVRARLSAQPPQPAYLRPPHVTTAKGGHPLLRR